MRDRSVLRALVIALASWLLAFVLCLKLGAVADADWTLIGQLRLPRALLASAVGAGLAVAGATLQALFSNPLCEPYTLGISSGSTLGAVLGASLGLDWMITGLAGSSFIGALVFTLVLLWVSRRPGIGNLTLLLAGVMLSFLGSSLVALWMAVSDTQGIQGALLWLLGDLSRARLSGALFSGAAVSLLILLVWSRSRQLDAMLLGEEGALSVGVDVRRLRTPLIILSSLIVGLCVSASGMIGFVGLVVPHFARRWVGSLHRALIPLSAIWGATCLTAADAAARALASPYDLPVGVVTALVGAPVFLWVVLKQKETA